MRAQKLLKTFDLCVLVIKELAKQQENHCILKDAHFIKVSKLQYHSVFIVYI